MSGLRESVLGYLELRRALGFRLKKDEHLLLDFAGFMEQRHAVHITAKLAVEWARRPASTSANYHAGRLRAVRSFARHHIQNDPKTEVPAADLLPRERSAFQPHIFSQEEISRVLAASLRPWGGATRFYCLGRYTIYGLLSVTGMRVSEALNLDVVNGHRRFLKSGHLKFPSLAGRFMPVISRDGDRAFPSLAGGRAVWARAAG